MAPVNTHAKVGGEKLNDLKLSRDEVDKFCKALKDEKFRKLLGEYAEEIQDPENRKRYEQEIAELEQERGYDVTWIHPQPGYVLKLSDSSAQKVFVNVCSSHQVDKPSCQRSRNPGKPGLNWSIPYALSKPRDDRDKTGATCRVYDVVFHPDTLYMAERNPRMRQLVRDTALQAVDDAFQAGLDRSRVVTPKLKYKGVPQACVVRRRKGEVATDAPSLQQHVEEKLRQDTDALSVTDDAASAAAGDAGATYETPEYRLVYRDRSAMEHLTTGGGSGRPEALVVRISLPRLSSAAGLDLDVGTTSLRLVSEEPARYRLLLSLPLPVDDGAGGAAFDKATRSLVVTLPVQQTPDSGIDSDGVRNESDEDAGGDTSSGPDSIPCEPVSGEGDGTRPQPAPEPERLYSLPSYSLEQDSRCLYLTVSQPSIAAESVRLERRQQLLLVTLSSVGAGLARLHFRLCLSLPAPMVSEPCLRLDGDSVRLRADKDVGRWTSCLLGSDPDHLQQVSIPWKEEESASTAAAASATEESVSMATVASAAEESASTAAGASVAEESVSMAAASAAEESVSMAAVSATEESASTLAVSPAEESSPMVESDAEEAVPASVAAETPAAAAEEAPVSTGARRVRPSLSACSVTSTSCDGPLSASSLSSFDESPSFQKKSILKKRYASESSADEVAVSGSLLPSSSLLSCDETEEAATTKKAVRFCEHIREKRYRSTASIVHDVQRAEKQRAKKKRARAAARRRHSEGDASSEPEESTAGGAAEQPVRCSSETDTSENDEAGPAADAGAPSKNAAKKRKNKRKQERRKKDVLNNELIFDLDM